VTPRGTLVRHIAGRTRFRVAEKRGDAAYFAHVCDQLGHCPGVRAVVSSDTTGSVLVEHEGETPDTLAAYGRSFGLFDLTEPNAAGERSRPPSDVINAGVMRLDEWVRAETGRTTDLRSVALMGLVGAAIWQALRGQFFPAAGTLIWYALTVASRDRAPAPRSAEEAGSPAEVRSRSLPRQRE
jgi:hypothetical protein